MKVECLLAKARQAVASARLLLDAGDVDGACNRAYYAMFDAARAALLASGCPIEVDTIRTHNGLISAFSLHLVKTGRVSVELGKALNRAEELRLAADYKGDAVELEYAHWVTDRAQEFVQVMQACFFAEPPRS